MPRNFVPTIERLSRLSHQVAGEEDREGDLAELPGLERERADVDPEPGAELSSPPMTGSIGSRSSTMPVNIAM